MSDEDSSLPNDISPFTRGGGADGSILLFNQTELLDGKLKCTRDSLIKSYALSDANNGIEDSVTLLFPLLSQFNVTAGDLIQFAGAVAVSSQRLEGVLILTTAL